MKRTIKIYAINLNYEFWLYIVSQEGMQLNLGNKFAEKKLNDLARFRLKAEQALINLRIHITCTSVNKYSQAIEDIERYLYFINKSQDKLSFSIVYVYGKIKIEQMEA